MLGQTTIAIFTHSVIANSTFNITGTLKKTNRSLAVPLIKICLICTNDRNLADLFRRVSTKWIQQSCPPGPTGVHLHMRPMDSECLSFSEFTLNVSFILCERITLASVYSMNTLSMEADEGQNSCGQCCGYIYPSIYKLKILNSNLFNNLKLPKSGGW